MSDYKPNTELGQIKLDSKTYSADRLSALINSGFISKGAYTANEELTIQQIAPLSVITLGKETYESLESKGMLEDDAIYLVETDNIDAFGKTITNVDSPKDANDVANKQYVDNIVDNIVQTPTYCPASYCVNNGGSRILSTDFNLSSMFLNLGENVSTLKLKQIAFVGREEVTDELSIDLFERNGDTIDDSNTIASSTSFECEQLKDQIGSGNTSWLYKFGFDDVELLLDKTYVISFSGGMNVRLVASTTDFEGKNFKYAYLDNGTIKEHYGFVFAQYILRANAAQASSFSGIIFNDKANADHKYKLYIRNGKTTLIRIA